VEVEPPVVLAPPVLRVLDQTALPHDERWLDLASVEEVCEAVASLRVRGAPLLGIVGAAGMAVAAEAEGPAEQSLRRAAERIARTRPTAVELSSGANGALQAALSATEDERTGALWAHARDYITRRIAE
jgi:methylthioribose-1-phosphate isomerase